MTQKSFDYDLMSSGISVGEGGMDGMKISFEHYIIYAL